MVVNNQSNGTVNWSQGNAGPAPLTATVQSGQLASGQESQPFTPSGSAPYVVAFTGACNVTSPKINDADATVTLDRNCAVTVS
jgi:hypothetical protein